jgi:hypothetical protein
MTLTRPPEGETHGAPVRDLSTDRASRTTVTTTMGKYLMTLGLYDPNTRAAIWDPATLHMEIQRAVIDIRKNHIKRTMLRDVMRGGTLPPTCLVEEIDEEEAARRSIIDGLQRTHVSTIALMTLLALEHDEEVDDHIAELVESIHDMGQHQLSVDEFVARPFEFQLWRDLTPTELVRLFMILNAGQQRVSPRHLFEIMGRQLRALFDSWGVPMLTERERRQGPGRRRPGRDPIEGATVYRYEYLLGGLMAYLDRNPHMRTSLVLQASVDNAALTLPTSGAALETRMLDIGEDTLRDDLKWVFINFREAMKVKYAGVSAWENAVMQSDTFVFPLLASLGRARENVPRADVEARKTWLIETLESDELDPLALGRGDDEDEARLNLLSTILNSISSNIGRRRRIIVFQAFNSYFERGPARRGYPLDWDLAQHL